jgi:hypothetical protein
VGRGALRALCLRRDMGASTIGVVRTERREAGGGASWGWTVTRPNGVRASAFHRYEGREAPRLSRTNGGTAKAQATNGGSRSATGRPRQDRECGPLPLLAMSGPRSGLRAEPGAAPDRGRSTGFARHQALAAAPAGKLGR